MIDETKVLYILQQLELSEIREDGAACKVSCHDISLFLYFSRFRGRCEAGFGGRASGGEGRKG